MENENMEVEMQQAEQEQAVKQSTIKSPVLKKLSHFPNTACGICQNAVWMQTKSGKIQTYCKVMRVLMDQDLTICDGQMMTTE
jgi:hypothetical protein